MLLFPHLASPETIPLRRNAPITSARSLKPKRPGKSLAVRKLMSPANLLRCRRQRQRLVRQRAQVGDHVGAFAVLLDAGKAHRGARYKALRVGDEFVEVVKTPFAALGLHGGREVEAGLALTLLLADDAIEVRTDAVRAALFEGVAGRALLCGGGPPLAPS